MIENPITNSKFILKNFDMVFSSKDCKWTHDPDTLVNVSLIQLDFNLKMIDWGGSRGEKQEKIGWNLGLTAYILKAIVRANWEGYWGWMKINWCRMRNSQWISGNVGRVFMIWTQLHNFSQLALSPFIFFQFISRSKSRGWHNWDWIRWLLDQISESRQTVNRQNLVSVEFVENCQSLFDCRFYDQLRN